MTAVSPPRATTAPDQRLASTGWAASVAEGAADQGHILPSRDLDTLFEAKSVDLVRPDITPGSSPERRRPVRSAGRTVGRVVVGRPDFVSRFSCVTWMNPVPAVGRSLVTGRISTRGMPSPVFGGMTLTRLDPWPRPGIKAWDQGLESTLVLGTPFLPAVSQAAGGLVAPGGRRPNRWERCA